jgi:hypothetical protein
MSIGLGSVTQSVWAENQTPDVQNAQNEPAKKLDDGKGEIAHI